MVVINADAALIGVWRKQVPVKGESDEENDYRGNGAGDAACIDRRMLAVVVRRRQGRASRGEA